MHMRLLFVTVALGLSATASAWGHVGGAAPARRQLGDFEKGNKCVSSSDTISVDLGACGKVKMGDYGVCAASQKVVDDGMKALSTLMEAFPDSMDSAKITASDCKSQGEEIAAMYCAGASDFFGETVKVKAQDMCDMYCSIMKKYKLNKPEECMSDSHCPGGVGGEVLLCCQAFLDMTKTTCEWTDAQLAKVDLKVMAATGICINDETKCYSAAGRYSASTVFALATGMLAMLMSSHN